MVMKSLKRSVLCCSGRVLCLKGTFLYPRVCWALKRLLLVRRALYVTECVLAYLASAQLYENGVNNPVTQYSDFYANACIIFYHTSNSFSESVD